MAPVGAAVALVIAHCLALTIAKSVAAIVKKSRRMGLHGPRESGEDFNLFV